VRTVKVSFGPSIAKYAIASVNTFGRSKWNDQFIALLGDISYFPKNYRDASLWE
jgi:hypothetical protein